MTCTRRCSCCSVPATINLSTMGEVESSPYTKAHTTASHPQSYDMLHDTLHLENMCTAGQAEIPNMCS
eukprot:3402160-Amphidinium_carterae.3